MTCLEILLHVDDNQAYINRKLIIAIAMWAKLYMHQVHHSVCAWKGSCFYLPCYLARNHGWCYYCLQPHSTRYKDMLDTKQNSRIYGEHSLQWMVTLNHFHVYLQRLLLRTSDDKSQWPWLIWSTYLNNINQQLDNINLGKEKA